MAQAVQEDRRERAKFLALWHVHVRWLAQSRTRPRGASATHIWVLAALPLPPDQAGEGVAYLFYVIFNDSAWRVSVSEQLAVTLERDARFRKWGSQEDLLARLTALVLTGEPQPEEFTARLESMEQAPAGVRAAWEVSSGEGKCVLVSFEHISTRGNFVGFTPLAEMGVQGYSR